MLATLQRTDKQVVALDIRSDDPRYIISEDAIIKNKKLHLAATFYEYPSTVVRQCLEDSLAADVSEDIVREEILQAQVDHLDGVTKEGLRIGVVLGAQHTLVFHNISRQHPSKRVFIGGTTTTDKIERFRHNAGEDVLYRKLRFIPDKPISEAEFSRVILDKSHPLPHGNRSDGMTDGEVVTLLTALDEVKNEALQTDRIMTREIEEILAQSACKS